MGNIVKDGRGVYRWVYEFNLFTNPTIFITVLKVLLVSAAIALAFGLAVSLPDLMSAGGAGDVVGWLGFAGQLALIVVGLALVGYVAYALVQGGKYCVVFTMDEQGITHRQMPKQYRKAQLVGELTELAGRMAGNPTTMGVGRLSARDSLSSDFSVVRSVKGSRLLRVIKVNEPFAKNQVYVEPDDYDFVLGYIRERCPNAKVRG